MRRNIGFLGALVALMYADGFKGIMNQVIIRTREATPDPGTSVFRVKSHREKFRQVRRIGPCNKRNLPRGRR